jgi:hypothetical protein
LQHPRAVAALASSQRDGRRLVVDRAIRGHVNGFQPVIGAATVQAVVESRAAADRHHPDGDLQRHPAGRRGVIG